MTATLVTAFPVTADSLNCRAEPNTSSAKGPSVNGNSIWDKTQDGCYVADYYVKAGSSGYVTGKCGGGSNLPTSDDLCKTLNKFGTDLITRWEGFADRPKPDPIGLPTVGYGHL
ncbi:hypothetical protein MAC_06065 [Metarhizium acridum CQMa 102]|uniref:Uncharacterized protein n=1 Tax=Metarhizium acridum (strain CQMa 102) TaxID=655827 RepID=E9E867_METAQ|nr:uncharacterized protein MAC_06065 [Metarhizium acridum CQMa 102]EFY87938.1 hypothetical protein MAC_06065 [Metarhizium acridum CQMa 102]